MLLNLGSSGDTLPRAKAFLAKSKELAASPEASLAEAFITASTDKPTALAYLSSLGTPSAMAAALRICISADGPEAAFDWTKRAGLDEGSFDAEGKFSYLAVALQIGRWDDLFRGAKTVAKSEIAEFAALLHVLAMARMLSAVPVELRALAASQVPFEAREFRLASDPGDIAARREARLLFETLSGYAESLGLSQPANVAADYALWLELRDPVDQDAGLEHLRESMRDPTKSLRRLNLALQFGLKLDFQAIETRLDQSVALSGLGSADEAFARFSLAFAQGGPKEAALYIARHRAQLFAHLQKFALTGMEIELLARAGSIDTAKQRLSEAVSDGLDETNQEILRRIISECSGADPVAERRATFEKTGDLRALVNLVDALEERNIIEELLPYAEKLFAKTHADDDCLRVAKCLSELDRHEDLLNFLSRNAGLVNSSVNLRSVWAWTLFRDGRFDDARNVLDTLKEYAHSPTHRALRANIAISTGDWASLLVLCEEIWTDREKVTADELLQAAQISEIVGGPHSREMVIAATEREPDDPAVLANAYFLAARGGWEQSQQVAAWIQRAAQKSGSTGPIQTVSLKQLVDQKPAWDKRAGDTLELLNAGKLPSFAAADVLGRTLLDVSLLPALSNPAEADVRKRRTIYAYSGARRPVPIPSGSRIAVDLSALVTLVRLDLLESLISKFRVVIPHSTLSRLFLERQRAVFHQPSRVKDAHLLRQFISSGVMRVLSLGAEQDANLTKDVGLELAHILASARTATQAGNRILVVRSPPIHRLGSLMDEEADVSAYQDLICSCGAVVQALKSKGVLTVAEEERAQAYLRLQERPWPNEPHIDPDTQLILEGLSVSHLRAAGVLPKFKLANMEVFIAQSTEDEVNALIAMDSLTDEVLTAIEKLRHTLAQGMAFGRVEAVSATRVSEDRLFQTHPTYNILSLSHPVDAIVVDDRYINHISNITAGDRTTPVICTLDLLDQFLAEGALTFQEYLGHRTSLRQAGYQLIPVTEAELRRRPKTIASGRISRRDSVVPFGMKGITGYVEGRHFLVGDFDAFWIGVGIEFAADRQAGLGCGVRDQFDRDDNACERRSTPVLGDVAEHPVLDLVPLLGSAGRILSHPLIFSRAKMQLEVGILMRRVSYDKS